jgi:hypothetical protein
MERANPRGAEHLKEQELPERIREPDEPDR